MITRVGRRQVLEGVHGDRALARLGVEAGRLALPFGIRPAVGLPEALGEPRLSADRQRVLMPPDSLTLAVQRLGG